MRQPKRQRDDVVRLRDPTAIRALAHPARLSVIEELYGGAAELTATECAELVGLSPSAMSYHLRALEKVGIVERAVPSEDGRERPWRAAGRSLQVDSANSTAAAGAAADVLGDTVLSRLVGQYGVYAGRRAAERGDWREASGISSGRLWLTAEELAAMQQAAFAALEPYRGRSRDKHPDGARPVRVALLAFPVDPPR